MRNKILETLQQKKEVYTEICSWFENEYNSTTSPDTLDEWEKNATEIHAQIKLLEFLLSDTEEQTAGVIHSPERETEVQELCAQVACWTMRM